MQNVADAVASGLISEALITKLKELEERKQTLEKQANEAQSPMQTIQIDTSLILSEYAEACQSPSLPAYKDFVSQFIDRIEVGKYVVDITLKTGLDVCPELNTTNHIRRQEIYEKRQVG